MPENFMVPEICYFMLWDNMNSILNINMYSIGQQLKQKSSSIDM